MTAKNDEGTSGRDEAMKASSSAKPGVNVELGPLFRRAVDTLTNSLKGAIRIIQSEARLSTESLSKLLYLLEAASIVFSTHLDDSLTLGAKDQDNRIVNFREIYQEFTVLLETASENKDRIEKQAPTKTETELESAVESELARMGKAIEKLLDTVAANPIVWTN